MATNPTFIKRDEVPETDYITLANEQIKKNGTIDPESSTYQNALIQYNNNINKGSVERLEVPENFCGYIDPNSGLFRVEPADSPELRNNDIFPTTLTQLTSVEQIEPDPYIIDQCLAIGLPGSYEYTTGECGEEDGDNACSGISWFSGGGTEGGTEKANQSVCGSGPGINSNTGIASSSPVTISGDTPPSVINAANNAALSENSTAGSIDDGVLTSISGTLNTYVFLYNVYDPPSPSEQNYRGGGLQVTVVYNTDEKEIKSVNTSTNY